MAHLHNAPRRKLEKKTAWAETPVKLLKHLPINRCGDLRAKAVAVTIKEGKKTESKNVLSGLTLAIWFLGKNVCPRLKAGPWFRRKMGKSMR